ncbi:transposase [Bradyrhizobium sp. USDA 4518]
MPWTKITREQYRRDDLRYASDMTDAEWAVIRRLLPRANRRGRPRKTELRRVIEAILYIVSTGCQWRALPQEFPPYSTVQGYFYRCRPVAEDCQRACPTGAKKAWTDTEADGSRDRQSKCANHASWRTARLRCRQAHLRPQAAHRDGYQWPPPWGSCSSGQRSGLPWRRTAAEERADELPPAAPRLCRPDLPRKSTPRRALRLRSMDCRDRRAASRRQRLPASAEAVGG